MNVVKCRLSEGELNLINMQVAHNEVIRKRNAPANYQGEQKRRPSGN